MTIFALLCVDKFGRRRLLYTGALIMAVSIIVLGIACHFQQGNIPEKACVDHSGCHSDTAHNHSFPIKSSPNPLTENLTSKGLNLVHTTAPSGRLKRELRNLVNDISDSNLAKRSLLNPDSVVASRRDNSVESVSENKGDNQNSETSKGENSSQVSVLQKIVGFAALTCYVAAYGFSFGPGLLLLMRV